jgi:hypothetical protein
VFSKRDASMLMQLMCCHPNADAIAAMQSGRGKDLPLFTIKTDTRAPTPARRGGEFEPDLKKVTTAHFGLTLMRTEKFKALPKPWFQDVPAPDQTWGEGRRDADISFWDKWGAAGNSLYIANRVPVGHLELMINSGPARICGRSISRSATFAPVFCECRLGSNGREPKVFGRVV